LSIPFPKVPTSGIRDKAEKRAKHAGARSRDQQRRRGNWRNRAWECGLPEVRLLPDSDRIAGGSVGPGRANSGRQPRATESLPEGQSV